MNSFGIPCASGRPPVYVTDHVSEPLVAPFELGLHLGPAHHLPRHLVGRLDLRFQHQGRLLLIGWLAL